MKIQGWIFRVTALASVSAAPLPAPAPWSFPDFIEIVADHPIRYAEEAPRAVLYLPGGRYRYGGRFEEMLERETDEFMEVNYAG